MVLNLFGTAVGAGCYFYQSMQGWAVLAFGRDGDFSRTDDIFLRIVVWPISVLSSSKPGSDITEVVEEHFGPTAGKLITLLYFFAIFPILLIYGNGDHQYG